MTYPQPNSNDPVQAGQDFFRLNTALVSPGDIYESEVTANALAVGPESDISRINVAYYDSTQATKMNQVTISPDRLMTGVITASPANLYVPSNVAARALIWPDQTFDQKFVPHMVLAGVPTPVGYVEFIRPVLDVIQYFKGQTSLPPQRNDKEYRLQELRIDGNFAAGVAIGYVFPYYGRKYACIEVTNCSGDTVHVAINGVDYVLTNVDGVQQPQHVETVLQQTTDLVHTTAGAGNFIGGGGGTTTGLKRVVTAAADGEFDALAVMVSFDSAVAANCHNVTIKVTVSDSPR